MKLYTLILLTLFLASASYCQNSYGPIILTKETKKDFEQKTDELVKQYESMDIFSGVVLIAHNGQAFYHKAFGLANRENNIPNTLETRFVIGSMNKTFTHIIILQLINEGKLSFSDKMTKYLDGFTQRDASKITIEHLLNHTSGFGDYYGPDYWDLPYERRNIPGITPILKKMELNFEPGTENEYSNAGYILLGSIIEKITGKSFSQNTDERIKKPLKLNSLVLSKVKEIPNRATGYLKNIHGIDNNEEFITEPRSDGGFYATAEDMMKFYREFFYGNKLLNEKIKSQDEFFNQIKPTYKEFGRGIPIAGGFNGANTIHLERLADNVSIVVFSNMDEPVAENIALGIHNILNGKEAKKASLPAKLNVYTAYKKSGADHIKSHFDELTVNWHPADPKDLILNNLGYDLMMAGELGDALVIFKLNTELFPNIGNCWDSYGEALLKTGDKVAALKAYKKALEINPNIPSAKKMIEELKK